MTLADITSAGATPALEMTLRFAGARQRLLAHNVANLSTPDFRPLDVDPAAFQQKLADAIDDRRQRTGGMHGELRFEGGRQIRLGANDSMRLEPDSPTGNILFHDRNNRDIERMMQDLAENAAVYRVAVDLMSQQKQMIHSALGERV